MTQYNGPQDPTQWSGQPPRAGGPYPPVPPGPAPKKRNWFARHKILTGLFGVVAIIAIVTAASASGGSSDPEPTTAAGQPTAAVSSDAATGDAAQSAARKATKKETQKETQQAAPTPAKKDPGIGTPVKSGDLQFTVTKVVRNQTQVGQEYMTEKAQGRYTLVYVTVRNVGGSSDTLLDDDQKIKDAANKTYSPNSMAELSLKNNDVFFEQINPGNAVDGVLVYDMPAGVHATAIEFSGGLFEDAKTVQLP